eukprot:5224337-Alexandrium_andersonii.AAC.1
MDLAYVQANMQAELDFAHRVFQARRNGSVVVMQPNFRTIDNSRSMWATESDRPLVEPAAAVG